MSYQQLSVWIKATDLAVSVYQATVDGPLSKDFGLRDQIRRSAVSIPSNIAEGEERESPRDSIRFHFIAKASAAELTTQLIIAEKIGVLDMKITTVLLSRLDEISRMLRGLIQAKEAKLK